MAHKDIYDEEYLDHGKLSERRKFALSDLSGHGKDVSVEVNWNSLSRKTGHVKFSIDGNEVVVSREHLYAILFMLGSSEEQTKMASPFVRNHHVLKFFKMIGVTAMKDIKRGEMLNVPLEFTFNPDDSSVIIGKGSMENIKKMALHN